MSKRAANITGFKDASKTVSSDTKGYLVANVFQKFVNIMFLTAIVAIFSFLM